MLQNLTKGKMVEWVVLLVALVALGLSIAAFAKPCKDTFASALSNDATNWTQYNGPGPDPNCCDLSDPQGTCNSGYYCAHDESGSCSSGGHCVPGSPPCLKSGNRCSNNNDCCSLKCMAEECVGNTPTTHCDSNACKGLVCTHDPSICDQCNGLCQDNGDGTYVCKC